MNIIKQPSKDGFYWLNDVSRYGWAPVEVKGEFYWIIGSTWNGRVVEFTEWIPLPTPNISGE